MCPSCEVRHSEELIKLCDACFAKLESERLVQSH